MDVYRLMFGFLLSFCIGCASMNCCDSCCGCQDKSPKAMLSWQIGEKDKKDEAEKKDSNGTKDDTPAEAKDKKESGEKKEADDKKNGEEKKNGNGDGAEKNGGEAAEPAKPEEPNEIVTDRPDFTEASTTVGKGRIQLESGYTYSRNKDTGVSSAHSFPEALLRIGMFANWFEIRIGQNYTNSRNFDGSGGIFNTDGGEDLYLGVKLALTEQKKCLPETALIIQTTVPTGHPSVTAEKVLPGVNYLFGWDVVKDALSCAGSIQGNAQVDDSGHSYLEMAQSFTIGYTLTKKTGAFTELFGFQPDGATSPGVGPEYYFDGGFTYKLRPNLQFDIRGGIGLNKYADDFFVGTGFAVRF